MRTDKNGKCHSKKYGPHSAVHRLKKWVQIGKKVYVAETDVHHAYGSVVIAILIEQMRRVIKDANWIKLASVFLHYDPDEPYRCGLVLGHYTSPWFFNFYLKDFDHFAASFDGVKYLRFADNMFFVGTNKRKVHRALDASRQYLRENLRKSLKVSSSSKGI